MTLSQVWRRSSDILRGRGGSFFAITAIVVLPDQVLELLRTLYLPEPGPWPLILPLTLLSFGLSVFAALTVATFALEAARGEDRGVSANLRDVSLKLGNAYLVMAFQAITIVVGMLLLVIPGLIALAGFLMAIPVLVAEHATATDSLRRAWDLSRGYRIRLAAVFGGMILLYMLAVSVGALVVYGAGGFSEGFVPDLTSALVGAAFDYLCGTLYTMVYAVLSVAFFLEIREDKEGTNIKTLATVFE